MLKKTLKRAVIGALIGIAAGNIISALSVMIFSGGGAIVSQKVIDMCGGEAAAMLLHTFITAFMGAVDCAGMTFYEMEHWSLFRIIVSHLALIYVTFLPTAYILDWMGSPDEFLIICGMMLVGYFIVYIILGAIYKKQVKELNEMNSKAKNYKKSA